MGRFKHLVATGVQIHRQRAREYERWSRMLLREYGPPLSPHIIDVRKWSVAFLKKTLEKLNCWEFMGCAAGNGEKVCPVFTAKMLDGVHGGQNGGRVCWIVAGTLCGGEVQGSAEEKARTCYTCDFYRAVLDEEGADFIRAHILGK